MYSMGLSVYISVTSYLNKLQVISNVTDLTAVPESYLTVVLDHIQSSGLNNM